MKILNLINAVIQFVAAYLLFRQLFTIAFGSCYARETLLAIVVIGSVCVIAIYSVGIIFLGMTSPLTPKKFWTRLVAVFVGVYTAAIYLS